jgi:hypothetical protein
MPCNCSNEYCYDKVPEESIIRRNGEPAYIHLKVGTVATKAWRWEDWLVLCDNCRVDDNGWLWEPYVPSERMRAIFKARGVPDYK